MKRILILLMAGVALCQGQQKISARTTLLGASIDSAGDWIPIVDTSAGTSGDKKTTLGEMWKALGGTNVSGTELGYLDGVTSSLQTQINAKAASSHTHTLSNLTQSGATTGQVPMWDGSAWVASSPWGMPVPISNTELPSGDVMSHNDGVSNAEMVKWQYKSPGFAVRGVQLVYGNQHSGWEGTIRSEAAKAAIRASVEYPAGVFHPVSFGGKRDVVLQAGGIERSGVAEVQIPANTYYWVRTFVVCQAGTLSQLPSNAVMYSTGGGGANVGVVGVAAAATATVSGGFVTDVTLTAGGSGYTPGAEITCTLSGGGGSGADIRAYVSQTGIIEKRFRIANRGTGYSSAPSITIPGNATGSITYQAIPVDLTESGTLAQSINFGGYGPSAIIGIPADAAAHRSYVAIGDSITCGYYDANAGHGGWVKRVSETYNVPIINFGISGGSAATTWSANSKNWDKMPLTDGVTDAIVALGTNDTANSAATIQADITTLVQRLQARGLRVSLCTIPPKTNASNVPAATEAARVTVNTWIRTAPLGVVAVFDTADALETARNSGVWKAGHYHSDGIHPNSTGFDAMASAFSAIAP